MTPRQFRAWLLASGGQPRRFYATGASTLQGMTHSEVRSMKQGSWSIQLHSTGANTCPLTYPMSIPDQATLLCVDCPSGNYRVPLIALPRGGRAQ